MIWFNDTKLKILIETAKEALSDIRAVYIKETKENRSFRDKKQVAYASVQACYKTKACGNLHFST
ncbi:hypothetical protein [Bacteroides heparinolyticus]|uniref:hypothetical protein n=1 Tax=Prevotella heparinolytica TaxID=28113 RepID=UPI0035A1BBD3